MSQISVSDNKIIYTPLTSGLQGTYIHRKGPNKFGGNIYSNTQHIVVETTWYKVLNLISGNTQFRELSRYDIHGTFTKNIEDGILYYQITSIGPSNDPTVIIPANPYTRTDTFDITFWEPHDYVNNVGITAYVFVVCKDIDSAKNVKFTFDFTTNGFYY